MSKKKSGRILSVDFTGVETKELIPDGDYAVIVKEVTEESGDKGKYLNWVMEINTGEFKGKRLYYITSLTKQSLWNLRAVLEALGIEVSKSKMQLDIQSYRGMEMGVSVETEKYKGKLKNTVVDIYNLEDSGDDDEEGEDKEDLEEMDIDELIEYAAEQEIDLTRKQKKSKAKTLAAIQEAEKEGDEGEGDEEDDEEDIEAMDLDELIEYAQKQEIDLTRKQKKSKNLALAAIQEAEEEGEVE